MPCPSDSIYSFIGFFLFLKGILRQPGFKQALIRCQSAQSNVSYTNRQLLF